jgi:hypothetical protein
MVKGEMEGFVMSPFNALSQGLGEPAENLIQSNQPRDRESDADPSGFEAMLTSERRRWLKSNKESK